MPRQRRDWEKIVEEQRQSGESARAFCEAQGIHPGSFYRNRKRFVNQPLVEVSVSGQIECAPIVIQAGRYSVSIQERFDRESLKAILKIIEEIV